MLKQAVIWNKTDWKISKFTVKDFKHNYFCIWNRQDKKIPYGKVLKYFERDGALYCLIEPLGYTTEENLLDTKKSITEESEFLDLPRVENYGGEINDKDN